PCQAASGVEGRREAQVANNDSHRLDSKPRVKRREDFMKRVGWALICCICVLTFAACGQKETANTPAASAAAPLGAGIDSANMDKTVRLQDDFYKYVNGTWLTKTEIPADKTSYGAFVQLADGAEKDLRELIETSAKATDRAPDSVQQQVGDFFNSFMD